MSPTARLEQPAENQDCPGSLVVRSKRGGRVGTGHAVSTKLDPFSTVGRWGSGTAEAAISVAARRGVKLATISGYRKGS